MKQVLRLFLICSVIFSTGAAAQFTGLRAVQASELYMRYLDDRAIMSELEALSFPFTMTAKAQSSEPDLCEKRIQRKLSDGPAIARGLNKLIQSPDTHAMVKQSPAAAVIEIVFINACNDQSIIASEACDGGGVVYKGGCFSGELRQGKRHGQGTYTTDEWGYVGEWKDGVMHGQGTYTADEFEYVGEFKDNKFNGQGTLTNTADEFEYVGNWKDDSPAGQGTYTTDGFEYVGKWKGWAMHGQGTTTWASGTVYEGRYRDSKRGCMPDSDVRKFRIAARKVYPYQVGTTTRANGDIYVCSMERWDVSKNPMWPTYEFEWELTGTSNLLANEILLDTGEYVGSLKKDKPNGTGVFTFKDGNVLDGKWKKGKFISGTFTYANGAIYSGKWKKGKFKGERLPNKE